MDINQSKNQKLQYWSAAAMLCMLTYVLYTTFGVISVFALLLLPFALYSTIKASTAFVILFILFSYFRLHEAFPVLYNFKIPKMLALAAMLGIVWHLFISLKLKPFWHTCHAMFTIFFFWITVCVFMATNRAEAMSMYTGTLSKVFLMVFVISWLINTAKLMTYTRIGIMISGALLAGVAIYNKLNGIGLIEGTRVTISREYRSQIGDPNDLSLVLLFPVAFFAGEVFNSNNKPFFRFLAFLGMLLMCWGIIATQSRGGLLGILTIMGFFISKRIKNPIVLGGIGALSGLFLLAVAGISDRQSGGAAEEGVDASAMGRIYAWQAAINMALSNPFTGVGISNFYVNYFFYSPHWDGKNHAVHSTWFQVLGEMGFVGLILFAMLIVSIFKSLRRSNLYCKSKNKESLLVNVHILQAGLFGFMVSGTFLTQAFTWPLYIVLSLTIALERLLTKEEDDKG